MPSLKDALNKIWATQKLKRTTSLPPSTVTQQSTYAPNTPPTGKGAPVVPPPPGYKSVKIAKIKAFNEDVFYANLR